MAYGDVSGGTGYPRVELYDADYNKVGTFDLQYCPPGLADPRRPDIVERPVPLSEFVETVDDETVPIEKGFKIEFELTWPAIDEAGRGELAILISHKTRGGLFKVWPHYGVDGVKGADDPDRWYICHLVDFSGIGEYVRGQDGGDLYVGYGRVALVFRTKHPMRSIYHDEAKSSWTAVCMGLTLDGQNDQVSFGSDGSLNVTADKIFIEFFWRPEYVADQRRILSKGGAYFVWQMPGAAGGTRVEGHLIVGGLTKRTDSSGWAADLEDDTWYRVKVVGDGSYVRVYVDYLDGNGYVDMGGEAAYSGDIATTGNILYAGSSGTGYYAKGTIRHIKMKDPADGDRWMLNAPVIEGSPASSIRDVSPNANHGGLTGGPVWYEPAYEDDEMACWGDVNEEDYTPADLIGQWTDVGEIKDDEGRVVAHV